MKKRTSLRTAVLMLILLLTAAVLIGAGIYLIYFKNLGAFERQKEERELADEYIDDLILQFRDPKAYREKIEQARKRRQKEASLAEENSLANGRTSSAEEGTDEDFTEEDTEEDFREPYTLPYDDYTDDNYYSRDGIVYTPDYARGEIDCVLEVPTAGIRRGVYTGTWDDIAFNLDIWMVTVSRPDYELGKTHYCIYGHNHTVQDLSFNRLQKVQVGESFYLTAASGRYTYEITNVFALAREETTRQYVDNFTLSSDKCYLITCGRDDGVRNFRYLDLIVEGTLTEHLTIEEYADLIGR